MKVSPEYGMKFEQDFCDECKEKIARKMSEMKEWPKWKQLRVMANPNRFAQKLSEIACSQCRIRVVKRLRGTK